MQTQGWMIPLWYQGLSFLLTERIATSLNWELMCTVWTQEGGEWRYWAEDAAAGVELSQDTEQIDKQANLYILPYVYLHILPNTRLTNNTVKRNSVSTHQINKLTAVYGDYFPRNQTFDVKRPFDHWWGSQQPWGLPEPWTICWTVMPEPCWEMRNIFIRGRHSKPGRYSQEDFSDFCCCCCLFAFVLLPGPKPGQHGFLHL